MVKFVSFIFLFNVNLSRLGTDLPIPWLLHGDGARFSEVDSMQVVSMRCVISSVSIQYSEFVLACLPKVQGLTAAGSLFRKLLLRVSNTWRRGSLLMAHQSEKEFFLSLQGIWSGTLKNLVGLQPCQTNAALTAMQTIYLKVAQCHLQISETMRASWSVGGAHGGGGLLRLCISAGLGSICVSAG